MTILVNDVTIDSNDFIGLFVIEIALNFSVFRSKINNDATMMLEQPHVIE